MDKVQVDQAGEEHAKATVSSGTRGRPLVELIEKLEARNSELAKAHGISSAESRRLEAEAEIRRAEAAIEEERREFIRGTFADPEGMSLEERSRWLSELVAEARLLGVDLPADMTDEEYLAAIRRNLAEMSAYHLDMPRIVDAVFEGEGVEKDGKSGEGKGGRIEGVLRRRAARNGLTLEAQMEADRRLLVPTEDPADASLSGLNGIPSAIEPKGSSGTGPHLTAAGYDRDSMGFSLADEATMNVFGPVTGRWAFAGVNLEAVTSYIRERGMPLRSDEPKSRGERIIDLASTVLTGATVTIAIVVALGVLGVFR